MDSKKLLTFIKRHPLYDTQPPIQFSELSRTLLDKIVNQIHLGQNAWKLETTYNEHILGQDQFPKGADFYHIVDEIREEIEVFSKIGKRYSFTIGSRPIVIYAIYPYRTKVDTKKTFKLLDESVKKMYCWLYAANNFAPRECSREIVIYWYLTDRKKHIPKKGTNLPFDEIHANTAFTRACPIESNAIYIFRKEEWFKVFIHETFHSLGMDFASMSDEYAKKAMFEIFPVRCDLRFYEAYTETWAEIINILFLSMEKNGGLVYKNVETSLKCERMFSIFQKTKVLHHHKMNYRDICSPSNYTENTNVFSYFILKSIFLFFCNEFVEWCALKNKGTVAFKKTPMNIIALVDFIKSKYKHPAYLYTIQQMEEWYSHANKKGFEMNTMRMSIHEGGDIDLS